MKGEKEWPDQPCAEGPGRTNTAIFFARAEEGVLYF